MQFNFRTDGRMDITLSFGNCATKTKREKLSFYIRSLFLIQLKTDEQTYSIQLGFYSERLNESHTIYYILHNLNRFNSPNLRHNSCLKQARYFRRNLFSMDKKLE